MRIYSLILSALPVFWKSHNGLPRRFAPRDDERDRWLFVTMRERKIPSNDEKWKKRSLYGSV